MKKRNLTIIICLVFFQISLLGQSKSNIRIDAGLSSLVINKMRYDGYGLSAGVNVFINKYLYSSAMIGFTTGENPTDYPIFTPTAGLIKMNLNIGVNIPIQKFNIFAEAGMMLAQYTVSKIIRDVYTEINGRKIYAASNSGYGFVQAGIGLTGGFNYQFVNGIKIGIVYSRNQFFQNKNTHETLSFSFQKNL